jgi:ribonuclease HI
MTKIYTDGSSRGNPGPGGYGAVLIMGENVLEIGGRENMTTNNRMEITACIQALNNIPSNLFNEPITLYSDSEYVVKSMTLWISGWQKKGWRTASKKGGVKQGSLGKAPLSFTRKGYKVVTRRWAC